MLKSICLGNLNSGRLHSLIHQIPLVHLLFGRPLARQWKTKIKGNLVPPWRSFRCLGEDMVPIYREVCKGGGGYGRNSWGPRGEREGILAATRGSCEGVLTTLTEIGVHRAQMMRNFCTQGGVGVVTHCDKRESAPEETEVQSLG